jgi:exodeoxyribonuclease VII large subunit
VDFTIADFAADLRASTPSAAAELVIRPQAEWEREIEDLENRLAYQLKQALRFRWEKLHQFQRRLGDPRRRLADLILRLDDYADRLRRGLVIHLRNRSDGLRWVQERIRGQNPLLRVRDIRSRLELATTRLRHLMSQRIGKAKTDLQTQGKALRTLSPWNVLERGYALAQTLPGLKLIKDAGAVQPGQTMRITLARGEVDCRVEQTRHKEESDFVQGTV